MEQIKSRPVISIDNLSDDQVIELAKKNAVDFCNKSIISELKDTKLGANCAYVTHECEYIKFTIVNNPFGIYNKSVDEKSLKTTIYSFPESCIDSKVKSYFETFHEHIDKHFKFDRLTGATKYKTESYQGFRPFLVEKDNEKFVGSFNIECSKNKYLISVRSGERCNDNITNLGDLLLNIPKFSTAEVLVKPSRLTTCYKNYGLKYKLAWKIAGINVIESVKMEDLLFD